MLNLPTEYHDGITSKKGLDLDTITTRPSARRALIVDDDPDTVDLIKIIFRNAGMDVVGAFSGKEAIQKCSDTVPSVILLDLMMPDMDGWETYQNLRQVTDVPVIVVSADTKKENVVKGLNSGFDDYVTKPFFPPELVARVNTVLRRASGTGSLTRRIYPSIELSIDFETHEVVLRGEDIHLSSREFALLEVLATRAPRLVRYEEIATKIWETDNYKVRNRIKYLIYLLRRKVEVNPDDPQLIVNREGLGYQLNIGE
ncbi:MAG: response regulator transcription factor [Chloroflexota bacterium]|nr:MAG: response regulator transcription factor [Chloroflexota bacterium]